MNKYAANSRWKESKGCIRKRRFADAESAEIARISLQRERAYRCEYCRGWHLTGSMPASERVIRGLDKPKEETPCANLQQSN